MNMHCASRIGWIRSLKGASPHAPEEMTDPAQAGSAASGRAPAGARAAKAEDVRQFRKSDGREDTAMHAASSPSPMIACRSYTRRADTSRRMSPATPGFARKQRRKTVVGAALPFLATALLLVLPGTVGAQVRPAQQELVLSESYVMVDESKSNASYGVKLNTQPTGNVTLEVASSDAGIAILNTVSSGTFTSSITLTFTPNNWSSDQHQVHVKGVNDDVDNLGDSRLAIITHTPSGGGYGTGDVKTVHAWVNEAPRRRRRRYRGTDLDLRSSNASTASTGT